MQPVTADTGAVICENRRAEQRHLGSVDSSRRRDQGRGYSSVRAHAHARSCHPGRVADAALPIPSLVLWYRPTTKFSDFNGIPYLSEGEIAKFDPIVLRRV